MKTTYTSENIATFLETAEKANPATLVQLTEGHMSQAFSFETDTGQRFVLRIADTDEGFKADKYASDVFGPGLLAPKVNKLGHYDVKSFYCVSELINGKTTDSLEEGELQKALPSIQAALANMYNYNVSSFSGYGHLDKNTGNAPHASWRIAVAGEIEAAGEQAFRDNATAIGLEPALVNKIFSQFRNNLPYASEVRCLLHGDPAFDNMLVDNSHVTAVIDWAQMGYGDWVSDFARLDFWHMGRYGDIKEFAKKFNLDSDHLNERVALYWATNALWTIEYADTAKNTGVGQWLREYVAQKLI